MIALKNKKLKLIYYGSKRVNSVYIGKFRVYSTNKTVNNDSLLFRCQGGTSISLNQYGYSSLKQEGDYLLSKDIVVPYLLYALLTNEGTLLLWLKYNPGTTITDTDDFIVHFRNRSTSLSLNSYNYVNFDIQGHALCTGNITALIGGSTTCSPWCFYKLFSGCAGLYKAPTLFVDKPADNCFCRILLNCPNIKDIYILFIDFYKNSSVFLDPDAYLLDWNKINRKGCKPPILPYKYNPSLYTGGMTWIKNTGKIIKDFIIVNDYLDTYGRDSDPDVLVIHTNLIPSNLWLNPYIRVLKSGLSSLFSRYYNIRNSYTSRNSNGQYWCIENAYRRLRRKIDAGLCFHPSEPLRYAHKNIYGLRVETRLYPEFEVLHSSNKEVIIEFKRILLCSLTLGITYGGDRLTCSLYGLDIPHEGSSVVSCSNIINYDSIRLEDIIKVNCLLKGYNTLDTISKSLCIDIISGLPQCLIQTYGSYLIPFTSLKAYYNTSNKSYKYHNLYAIPLKDNHLEPDASDNNKLFIEDLSLVFIPEYPHQDLKEGYYSDKDLELSSVEFNTRIYINILRIKQIIEEFLDRRTNLDYTIDVHLIMGYLFSADTYVDTLKLWVKANNCKSSSKIKPYYIYQTGQLSYDECTCNDYEAGTALIKTYCTDELNNKIESVTFTDPKIDTSVAIPAIYEAITYLSGMWHSYRIPNPLKNPLLIVVNLVAVPVIILKHIFKGEDMHTYLRVLHITKFIYVNILGLTKTILLQLNLLFYNPLTDLSWYYEILHENMQPIYNRCSIILGSPLLNSMGYLSTNYNSATGYPFYNVDTLLFFSTRKVEDLIELIDSDSNINTDAFIQKDTK